MPAGQLSAHVSRGETTAEAHDRRTYTPDSADVSLSERNVIIHDVGDFRSAVNDEMRPHIAAYNEKRAEAATRKRAEIERYNAEVDAHNAEHAADEGFEPRRKRSFHPEKYAPKSYDYYAEVEHSRYKNNQSPTYEYVIGFGRRETCGVCDDEFDADYWHELKKAGDVEGASAYVASHLSSGEKGAMHDVAREMCLELGRDIVAHPERYFPSGAMLLMVVLHDDEPGGIPHLQVVFTPFAEGYSKGLYKRISLSKCFHDAGYEGNSYLKECQNKMKSQMEHILHQHGLEREVVGDTRSHVPLPAYRERRRAERARADAEQVEEELREARRERDDALDDLARAREAAEKAEADRLAAFADSRKLKDENERLGNELRVARKLNFVLHRGYKPPTWARFIAADQLPDRIAEEFQRLHGDELSDDDLDAQLDLIEQLVFEEYGCHDGYEVVCREDDRRPGLWIVDKNEGPYDPVRHRDAVNELEDQLLLLGELGFDPTVAHPGIDGMLRRKQELDARERELDSLVDEATSLVSDLRSSQVRVSVDDHDLEDILSCAGDALERTWDDMESVGMLSAQEHYDRMRAWGEVRGAFAPTSPSLDGTSQPNPEFARFVGHLMSIATDGVERVRAAYRRSRSSFHDRLERLRSRVFKASRSPFASLDYSQPVNVQPEDDDFSL